MRARGSAGGDPELHAAIASTNRDALVRVLEDVERSLRLVREAVAAREVDPLLRRAREIRQEWARERSG